MDYEILRLNKVIDYELLRLIFKLWIMKFQELG
jgi:hypothetical protein